MPTTLISSLTEEPTSAICVSTAERSAKNIQEQEQDEGHRNARGNILRYDGGKVHDGDRTLSPF